MAAAVVMTSVEKARALGIPESKWVFLHGCADANDIWNVTERVDFHSSPAIRTMGQEGVRDGGYRRGRSCRSSIFIRVFRPRWKSAARNWASPKTIRAGSPITGGLPYFGGPGNNYVMHSIVTMMEKLRSQSRHIRALHRQWLVHHQTFRRHLFDEADARTRGDAKIRKPISAISMRWPIPKLAEKPEGEARVETYTVATDRKGRRFGIIVGRLNDGSRFLANTPDDDATLEMMMSEEILGRAGIVAPRRTAPIFSGSHNGAALHGASWPGCGKLRRCARSRPRCAGPGAGARDGEAARRIRAAADCVEPAETRARNGAAAGGIVEARTSDRGSGGGNSLAIDKRLPNVRNGCAASWPVRGAMRRWNWPQWRENAIAALAAFSEDTVIFSHFIAINVAAGAALGDERVVVFSPDNCSVTIFESEAGRLRLIEQGHEAATKVN